MRASVRRLQADDRASFAVNLGHGRLDELDAGILELASLGVGNAGRTEREQRERIGEMANEQRLAYALASLTDDRDALALHFVAVADRAMADQSPAYRIAQVR